MSRSFGSEASAASPVLGLLDVAFRAAQLVAIARRDSEIATIKLVTEERVLVEEARIRSLMEHRTLAARDRVDSCVGDLAASSGVRRRKGTSGHTAVGSESSEGGSGNSFHTR